MSDFLFDDSCNGCSICPIFNTCAVKLCMIMTLTYRMVISIDISKLFAIQMCMILTMTFRMAKFKRKYFNRMPINDWLCDGRSNFNPIFHNFQDIYSLKCT